MCSGENSTKANSESWTWLLLAARAVVNFVIASLEGNQKQGWMVMRPRKTMFAVYGKEEKWDCEDDVGIGWPR